jgi:tetratricopeptide (TPR) repeat protein
MTNLYLLESLKSQGVDINTSFDNYKKALSGGYLGRQEVREQLNRFALGVGGLSEAPADFKDEVLRLAASEGQRGISENPLDPRPYILAGGLFGKLGMRDEALRILESAIKISPKKQQIYFEIADIYMMGGDYKGAIAQLEKALALDRSFDFARYNLAAAYILSGQQGEADRILIEGFGTVNKADKILVQVYSSVKNYPRLVGVWEAYVKTNPANLEYRKNLAGAYLLARDSANAVRVLQAAINEFPEFKEQGTEFIRQTKSGQY